MVIPNKRKGQSPIQMIIELLASILAFALLANLVITKIANSSDQSSISGLSSPISNITSSTLTSTPSLDLIKATVSLHNKILSVQEEITLKTPTQNPVFYIPSKNKANTTILKVLSNQQNISHKEQDQNILIQSSKKIEKINIQFEMNLLENKDTLSCNADYSVLTNFLITPAVIKNGEVIFTQTSKFGDPYVYNICNYSVTFQLDQSQTIWAPGYLSETLTEKSKTNRFDAGALRDFPAIIFNKANVYMEKMAGCEFYFYNAKELVPYVKEAYQFATSHIGPYPYTRLFVVRIPLSQRGMEQSSMVILNATEKVSKEITENVVIHEILHQWFYGIIGTDQVNEPYVDEGLVSFLSSLVVKNPLPVANADKSYKKKLKDYANIEEYYQKAYYDSEDYYASIYRGHEKEFFQMLKKIYEDKKFQILYDDALCSYIKKFIGGP